MREVAGFVAFAGALIFTASLPAAGAKSNEGALRAMAATDDMAECARTAHTTPLGYARRLSPSETTLADGTSIVVFEGGCEDGNDNDAIYIVAGHGSQRYKLISHEAGFVEKLAPDGTLRLMYNPGDVTVRYHVTSRWNGSTFEPVSSIMTWVSTGESKPAQMPLVFAVGASSATMSGTVREDYPDVYRFDARPGQTLSVDVRPRSGSVGRLEISVEGGAKIPGGSALSWHGTLPEAMHMIFFSDDRWETVPGGHYLITVDGSDQKRATYTMIVRIR